MIKHCSCPNLNAPKIILIGILTEIIVFQKDLWGWFSNLVDQISPNISHFSVIFVYLNFVIIATTTIFIIITSISANKHIKTRHKLWLLLFFVISVRSSPTNCVHFCWFVSSGQVVDWVCVTVVVFNVDNDKRQVCNFVRWRTKYWRWRQ